MFRAIGVILIVWFLSHAFSSSFLALDSALTETFRAVEGAAVFSQEEIEQARQKAE